MTLIGDTAQDCRVRIRQVGWQKVGWVLFTKEELIALRDTVYLELSNIDVLLVMAQLLVYHNCYNHGILIIVLKVGTMPDHISQY